KEGQAIAAIAAVEGDRAARDYGEALGLDEETIDEAVKAGRAIRNNAPTADARAAGSTTGRAYGEGMETGIFGMFGRVASAAASLVREAAAKARAEAREASPSRLFAEIGENMALGMAVGLDDTVRDVSDAAAQLVDEAAIAAARAAGRLSPVRLSAAIDAGTSSASSAGATTIQVQRGAVEVSITGSVSEAEARMVGGAVLDG